MKSKKNGSIEELRIILAFGIVLHHFFWLLNGKHFDGSLLSFVFNVLQSSVDVFFVISGFYVCKSLNEQTLLHFWVARFFRIFPLYFSVTTALALVQWKMPVLFSHPALDIWEAWWKSALFIPFEQRVGTQNFQGPVLSVGWTLNYEMFFYVLTSIIAVFAKKITAFCATAILSALFIYGITGAGIYHQFFGNSIVLELILGALLWHYPILMKSRLLSNIYFVLAINLSIFGFCYLLSIDLFDPVVRGFMLSYFSVSAFSFFYQRKASKSLEKMGAYSYPLYVLHLPVLYLSVKFSAPWCFVVFVIMIIPMLVCASHGQNILNRLSGRVENFFISSNIID